MNKKEDFKNNILTQEEIDSLDESPASLPPKHTVETLLMDYSQVEYLIELLKGAGYENPSLSLKFRATRDGDSNFHNICDGKPKTVMVIKSKESGMIFGGYTKNAWSSSGAYSNDNTAFLFSLSKFKKIPVKSACWATYNVSTTYSIVWGYPDDIKLLEGYLSNSKNVSKLNAYKDNENLSDTYLVDCDNFTVEDLEFFELV